MIEYTIHGKNKISIEKYVGNRNRNKTTNNIMHLDNMC